MTELLTEHGEQVVGRGIGPGGMIELYVAAESFTLTQVLPTGVSCILTMGLKWRQVPRPVKEIYL